MKSNTQQHPIYVSESGIGGAGRGVFASRIIKQGETIESCRYIEIPADEMDVICRTSLITYLFFFGDDNERALIALGAGSLYNHSYAPNTRYIIQQEEQSIRFIALSDIPKDAEILFDYTSGISANRYTLWFEKDLR